MSEDLYNFLIEAKKQTYANENVKKAQSSREASFDYENELSRYIFWWNKIYGRRNCL